MKKILMLATLCIAANACATDITLGLKLAINENVYEQTFTVEEEQPIVLTCGEYSVEIAACSEEELVAANCKIFKGCNEEDLTEENLVANPVFITTWNEPVDCELDNDQMSIHMSLTASK